MSKDNVLRIYNARSEWLATLAYGSVTPTSDAIDRKLVEYKGTEAVLVEHENGVETRRTAYHA
jgi:hypothetical protein